MDYNNNNGKNALDSAKEPTRDNRRMISVPYKSLPETTPQERRINFSARYVEENFRNNNGLHFHNQQN